MTVLRLQLQIEELCEVIQQLSRAAPDGPCWCHIAVNATMTGHSPKCRRARAALMIVQLHGTDATDSAPGYGFGV
jgi:hypothetical protein